MLPHAHRRSQSRNLLNSLSLVGGPPPAPATSAAPALPSASSPALLGSPSAAAHSRRGSRQGAHVHTRSRASISISSNSPQGLPTQTPAVAAAVPLRGPPIAPVGTADALFIDMSAAYTPPHQQQTKTMQPQVRMPQARPPQLRPQQQQQQQQVPPQRPQAPSQLRQPPPTVAAQPPTPTSATSTSQQQQQQQQQQQESPSHQPLAAPASWARTGVFPSSPTASADSARSSPSIHTARGSSLSAQQQQQSQHARRASRHNRRSSVATRRESLEIMAGVGIGLSPNNPSQQSFSAAMSQTGSGGATPFHTPRAVQGEDTSPPTGFESDAQRLLDELRERGRREQERTASELERDRVRALEALEGRVAAPSPMIDLGNAPDGDIRFAPPSPGYTPGAASTSRLSAQYAEHLGSPTKHHTSSPMVGLGFGSSTASTSAPGGGAHLASAGAFVNSKRNSWGMQQPAAGPGRLGVSELDALVEEEEEEADYEEANDSVAELTRHSRASSKRSSTSSAASRRSRRPASLVIAPPARSATTLIAENDDDGIFADAAIADERPPSRTSSRASFKRRPLRTTSSSSFTGITPSTAATSSSSSHVSRLSQSQPASSGASTAQGPASANPKRSSLRSLRLGSGNFSIADLSSADSPHSTASPTSAAAKAAADSKRRYSHFYTAAATGAAPTAQGPSRPSQTPIGGGLRALSMGTGLSPLPHADDPYGARTSPTLSSPYDGPPRPDPKRISSAPAGPGGAPSKRSSISYKTSAATSPIADGPLVHGSNRNSAAITPAQLQKRRSWRTSMASVPDFTSRPSLDKRTSFGAAYAPGNGSFGDLVVETDEEDGGDEAETSIITYDDDDNWQGSTKRHSALLKQREREQREQAMLLRARVEQLEREAAAQSTQRAQEIAEFERKAADEAHGMRTRINELEGRVEDERLKHRFELDGFTRELDMVKNALTDACDERDSLQDDVDGWRQRCAALEQRAAKAREDDAITAAQAKLINEMREQIYALVGALENEKEDHNEARKQVENLMAEQQRQKQAHERDLERLRAELRARESTMQPRAQPQPQQQQQPPRPRGDYIFPRPLSRGFDAASPPPPPSSHRHLSANTNSDTSVLSTSSFGRSFSGNTTEDTSLATDVEDSFSIKMSSPSSGHSSFSQAGSMPISRPGSGSRDSDFAGASSLALGTLQPLAEEEELDEDEEIERASSATAVTAHTAVTSSSFNQGTSSATPTAGATPASRPADLAIEVDVLRTSSDSTTSTDVSDLPPPTPNRDDHSVPHQHERTDSFVRQWTVSPLQCLFVQTDFDLVSCSSPKAMSSRQGSPSTTMSSSTLAATRRCLLCPCRTWRCRPSSAAASSSRTTTTRLARSTRRATLGDRLHLALVRCCRRTSSASLVNWASCRRRRRLRSRRPRCSTSSLGTCRRACHQRRHRRQAAASALAALAT